MEGTDPAGQETLRKHYSGICDSALDPSKLARRLFTKEIISNTAHEAAKQPLTPKDQRLDDLLFQVMANGTPGAFQKFVEAVEKHGAHDWLVERLKDTYREKGGVWSSDPTHVATAVTATQAEAQPHQLPGVQSAQSSTPLLSHVQPSHQKEGYFYPIRHSSPSIMRSQNPSIYPPVMLSVQPSSIQQVDPMDSVISDEHIAQVALFLPRWEDVAGQLCIGRLETDHIRAEPGTSIQTKNLRVLQYWKARWFHQATYRKLYEVLRMLGEAQSADRILRVLQGTSGQFSTYDGKEGYRIENSDLCTSYAGGTSPHPELEPPALKKAAVIDETPTMRQLQCLEGNGKTVRFMKAVEGNWKKLADLLELEDRVEAIDRTASGQTEEACRLVMKTWLEGAYRTPVTWATLLKVLHEMERPDIEKDLETALHR